VKIGSAGGEKQGELTQLPFFLTISPQIVLHSLIAIG